MNRTDYRDMTSGSPFRSILLFAIPVAIGNLFQNVYNLVDMTIAGHVIGDHAIASIAATSSLFSLAHAIAFGMNMGNTILISQAFGAKDGERIRQSYAGAAFLCMVGAVVLSTVFLGTLTPLMRMIHVPEEVFSDARSYIRIIFIGFAVSMLYNLFSCTMNALGDSRTSLFFLIFSSLLNIVLDYLLMVVIPLGVRGAALATVAAQAAADILCVIHIHRHYTGLRLKGREYLPSGIILRDMFPVGLSGAMTNSLFAIGSIAVQGTANQFGAAAITGYAAAQQIEKLFIVPSVALSNSCVPFSAQNYGARKIRRIGKGILAAVSMSLVCNLALTGAAFFWGSGIIQAVTATKDPEVIRCGVLLLRIVTPVIFMQTVVMSARYSIQGMGAKILPLVGTGIELFARCFSAWVLAPAWGYPGLCCSNALSWICSGAACLVFYKVCRSRAMAEAAGIST